MSNKHARVIAELEARLARCEKVGLMNEVEILNDIIGYLRAEAPGSGTGGYILPKDLIDSCLQQMPAPDVGLYGSIGPKSPEWKALQEHMEKHLATVDWATACALHPEPLRVDHISKLRSTFGLKEGEAFPSFGAWEMDYDFLTDSLVLKKTKPLFSRQEIEDGRVTPEETQRRAAAILNRDTDPERQRQESIAAEWMRRRA